MTANTATNNTNIGPCQLCGSTSYRKDQNGFLICSNGHQVEGYWEEQDDFDPVYGGLRRLVRPSQNQRHSTQTSIFSQSRSQQAGISAESDERVVLGDAESFAVFKVYQKILKAQISALKMTCYYLPESFEETVRAIWCKYVTAVGLDYSEEQVADESSQTFTQPTTDEHMERFPDLHLDNIKTDNPFPKIPRLPITLAILYLACVHCKIPMLLSEVRQWAVRGVIPYTATLNILTEAERKSLPRMDQRRFERVNIPSVADLYSMAARLSGFLARHQYLPLPLTEPIIIVWKQLDRLGLPLDLYPIVMRLLKRVGNGIEYRVCRVVGRHTINPEISVMAAVIFVVKLFYGLIGNVENSAYPYYNKLVNQHGLPDYEQLTQWWRKRLTALRQDFVLNEHTFLHWRDLQRYAVECKRSLPRDRSRLMQNYFDEFPDLQKAIEAVPTLYKLPSQHTSTATSPFASYEVDFVRVVSRRMANNCFVYPRNVQMNRLHKQFRWLLELGALSMNVTFHELYREYHRLFQLYPPSHTSPPAGGNEEPEEADY